MPPDQLAALVRASDRPALERLLVDGSKLPGPRANLALAQTFGREAAALPTAGLIGLVEPWLALSLDEAPVDSPAEFLPACAAIALGAALPQVNTGDVDSSSDVARTLCGPPPARSRPPFAPLEGRLRAGATSDEIAPLLERAAHDSRWRTREGVVLGLQAAGERDGPRLLDLCERWMASGDAYLMRAVVSSLAHMPILRQAGAADAALRHGKASIDWLQALPAARRATEGSRILTRSLGFALGTYVVAAPGPGFELLDALLAGGDRATRRIVNQNLGKARLAKTFPTQVTRLKGWIFEMDDWQRG